MKIIDAHVHLVEIIAGYGRRGELRAIGDGKARWANGEVIDLIPNGYGDMNFTGKSLLRLMNKNNIKKAVLLQGSMYGFQNEYTYEMCKRYPERFVGACTMDPFAKNKDDLLKHFIDDLGFKIMKFELSSGGGLMGYHHKFLIDGTEMEDIWCKASEVSATVALDIGNCTMESYQPEAIRRIALQYPNIKIVVCHLLSPIKGKSKILERDLERLSLPNIWFDLAALPIIFSTDKYPFPSAQKSIKIAKDIVGASKLIWGSDAPMTATKVPYKYLISYINEDIFDEEEMRMVFYNNALEVYFN